MNEKNTQAQAQEQAEVQAPAVVAPAQVVNTSKYAMNSGTSTPVYCTLDDSTMAGKKQLYNVKNRPNHTISEYINKTIRIKDIYIDVNNRDVKDADGHVIGNEDKPRTILIDDKGESYIAGVSIGIYQAVREIVRTFGDPKTWVEPLEVMVVQVSTPKGNMLSLEIV